METVSVIMYVTWDEDSAPVWDPIKVFVGEGHVERAIRYCQEQDEFSRYAHEEVEIG